MKLILVLACAIGFSANARSTRVRGYVTKNGRYVAPHEKTTPNKTKLDNFSHKGNINPYTGKKGTKK